MLEEQEKITHGTLVEKTVYTHAHVHVPDRSLSCFADAVMNGE